MIRLTFLLYSYVDFDTQSVVYRTFTTNPKNDQKKLQNGIQVVYTTPYSGLKNIRDWDERFCVLEHVNSDNERDSNLYASKFSLITTIIVDW